MINDIFREYMAKLIPMCIERVAFRLVDKTTFKKLFTIVNDMLLLDDIYYDDDYNSALPLIIPGVTVNLYITSSSCYIHYYDYDTSIEFDFSGGKIDIKVVVLDTKLN